MLEQIVSWITEYCIKKQHKRLLRGLYLACGNEFLEFPGKNNLVYTACLGVFLKRLKGSDLPSIRLLDELHKVLDGMRTLVIKFKEFEQEINDAWLSVITMMQFMKTCQEYENICCKFFAIWKTESDPALFSQRYNFKSPAFHVQMFIQKKMALFRCLDSMKQDNFINLSRIGLIHFTALKKTLRNLINKLSTNVGSTAFERILEDHVNTDLDFSNPFLSVIPRYIEDGVSEDKLMDLVDHLVSVDPTDFFAEKFSLRWKTWYLENVKLKDDCKKCDFGGERLTTLHNYLVTQLSDVQMLEDIVDSDIIDLTDDRDSLTQLNTEDDDTFALYSSSKAKHSMSCHDISHHQIQDSGDALNDDLLSDLAKVEKENDSPSPSLLSPTETFDDSRNIEQLFSQICPSPKYKLNLNVIKDAVPDSLATIPKLETFSQARSSTDLKKRTKPVAKRKVDFSKKCFVKLIKLDPSEYTDYLHKQSSSHNSKGHSNLAVVSAHDSTESGEMPLIHSSQNLIDDSKSLKKCSIVLEKLVPKKTSD